MDLEGRVHPLESVCMYLGVIPGKMSRDNNCPPAPGPKKYFPSPCPPLAVIWCYEVQLSGSQVMADLAVLSEEKMASHQFILQIRQLANTSSIRTIFLMWHFCHDEFDQLREGGLCGAEIISE